VTLQELQCKSERVSSLAETVTSTEWATHNKLSYNYPIQYHAQQQAAISFINSAFQFLAKTLIHFSSASRLFNFIGCQAPWWMPCCLNRVGQNGKTIMYMTVRMVIPLLKTHYMQLIRFSQHHTWNICASPTAADAGQIYKRPKPVPILALSASDTPASTRMSSEKKNG